MATQAEVAAHIGLSQPAVSKRVKAGILPAPSGRGGYSLSDCRLAELRNLRAVIAGRAHGDDADTDEEWNPRALEQAQIKLTEYKAEAEAMRVAQLRREVIEIALVAQLWARSFASVKGTLLAVPAAEAPELFECQTIAEIEQKLRRAMNEALTEIATAPLPDDFRKSVEELLSALSADGLSTT